MSWFFVVWPWWVVLVFATLNIGLTVWNLRVLKRLLRLRQAWSVLLVQSWGMRMHPIMLAKIGQCRVNIVAERIEDDEVG